MPRVGSAANRRGRNGEGTMTDKCSTALLESALSGPLPAECEEQFYHHLERCEGCRAALEQMAGGEAWRREAAEALSGDELDKSIPARDEWSDIDFTVEHLEPSDEPNVLGRLGGYDVLEIIGRGGMGVVLKGFDRELKRCVAIKVLSPHLAQSSLAKKRFAREAQAAAAVVHPNVLAIHQVQPAGRLPFLVMPLVAGESLAQRLVAQGRLELKETLRIGMQAAAGLAAAHEQGLVHRDVKPANILLEKGVERAVLTDFGLARAADDVSMTRWGMIAGTPQYMSPEQARGEPLDGRSDLFSLGCVLYEMATGVSPFRADSTMATLRRLIDDPPPAMASLNAELPPWFVVIVDRMLEKAPDLRYGSAQEVSDLLEKCLAHLQQPTSVPLPAELANLAPGPLTKPRKSRFSGVAVMLSLLGIGLFAAAIAATEPADISGEWSGDDWGRVVLKKSTDAEYSGTYTDTFGKTPGDIHVKWSRIERRFNGTWKEGEDRFGEISLRLVGDEIRGANTTDATSKINPATPRLADFAWKRVAALSNHATFGSVIERTCPFGGKCLDLLTGKLLPLPGGMSLADDVRRAGGNVFQPVTENSTDTLAILDVALLDLDQAAWSNLSAPGLEEKFAQQAAAKRSSQSHSQTRIPPGVYGFRTFDKTGLLQVLPQDDKAGNNSFGVTIRYKLVQKAVPAPGAVGDLSFAPMVELPDQANVRLVALAASPRGSSGWWAPNGRPITAAKWRETDEGLAHPPDENSELRKFVIAVNGAGEAPKFVGIDIDEKLVGLDGMFHLEAGGKPLAGWTGVSTPFARDAKTMSLTVYVATGSFQSEDTAGINRWSTGNVTGTSNGEKFTINNLAERAGHAVISLAAEYQTAGSYCKFDHRIRAVTKEGKSVTGHVVEGDSQENLVSLVYQFDGIKPADVAKFHYEARPIHIVKFRNVSLQPNVETQVEIVGGFKSSRNAGVANSTASAFGPVIERMLESETAIDFDTDRQAKLPEFKLKTENTGMFGTVAEGFAAIATWIEQQRMDAMLSSDDRFTAFGLKVKELTNEDWDKPDPAQLIERLGEIDPAAPSQVLLNPATNGPATYAFQTREGGRGIVQVIAFTEKGVKLRYKLVRQSAGSASVKEQSVSEATPLARPTFGPVMERVVPFGAPCAMQCLQFRSGRLFTEGHGPGTTKEQAAQDSKIIEEAGGVDAEALGGEEGFQFVGEGCLFTKDHSPVWEKQTAEETVKELQHASWITGVIEPKKTELPLTYLFKTSRGEMGILQLLDNVESDLGYRGSDKKGRGVKLRYKLVTQTGQPSAAMTPTFESVKNAAATLISKYFPDALVKTTDDEFTARYATQEFQFHPGSKGGDFSPNPDKQVGPSAEGFILTVRQMDEPYNGQAELPQTFQKPYWTSFGNAAYDPTTKHGVWVGFDFGARLDPAFYAAMLEVLKLAHGSANNAGLRPASTVAPLEKTFGPAIELTLRDPNESLENSVVDLGSAKLLTIPENVKSQMLHPDANPLGPEASFWTKANHVDVQDRARRDGHPASARHHRHP